MLIRLASMLLLTALLSGCGSMWQWVLTDQEKRRLRVAAEDAAACQLSRAAQTPMLYQELYQWRGGFCERVEVRNEVLFERQQDRVQVQLYGDRFCRQPLPYRLTHYYEFCSDYAQSGRLGDASDLDGEPAPWTLDPASRLALPVEPLWFNHQPYMQRYRYVTRQVGETRRLPVDTELYLRRGSGECALEMRVFKRHPQAAGLKPLILFHSGGLQQRGLHSLALQSQVSLYTDQGFLVFMPFLRTLGDGDGPVECRDSDWAGVKADADSALQWVRRHASALGGNGDRPALMGAGSGGLLAGWLSLQRADQVAGTLLLYPFVDSADLLGMIKHGQYRESKGVKLLQLLTGRQDLDRLSPTDPLILDTSLAAQAGRLPSAGRPPLRIIHGERDRRIPLRQSQRLCQAWQPAGCQEGQLIRIAEAGYQLDYCLLGVDCPAGDADSRQQVREALQQARRWLMEVE
ncbi:alpha/beta hydrolase family protein [Marinobacterium arenosum]|uniref:alpha/beta hydrolase family protein n=1 Tax=Marinobacterium arenosum TaxID=2862496 RepID=UPI001C95596B|nr:alpha/beta hydrolase fold domain-containing protein [Marinobacterium arenosum]MBY4678822.1 alpha/beta hydrolase fold domain-containing protein [Marinobacterium arenosum]